MERYKIYTIVLFLLIGLIIYYIKKKNYNYGEDTVEKILKKLPFTYKVINDVMLLSKGKYTQVDHIVVSKKGIFVIETKGFVGNVYGNSHLRNWRQKSYTKDIEFHNPILQNRGHVLALKDVLSIKDESIFIPVVAFSDTTNLFIDTNDDIVIKFSELKKFIKQYKSKKLTRKERNNLYREIKKANKNNFIRRKQHLKQIDNKIKNDEKLINKNICPRCGSRLKIVHGRNGRFIGCTNYPECRFTDKFK